MLQAAMILIACFVVVAVLWFIPEMNVEQPTTVNKQEHRQEKEESAVLDKAKLEQIKEDIESSRSKGGQLLKSFTSSYYDPTQVNREEQIPKYEYVDGIVYYVLEKEYAILEYPLNPQASLLYREYIKVDGLTKNSTPYTEATAIDKQESLSDVKEFLKFKYPDSLHLPPNTIVSDHIIDQWKSEAYNPLHEYTEESPRRLTIEKLKKQAQSQLERQ